MSETAATYKVEGRKNIAVESYSSVSSSLKTAVESYKKEEWPGGSEYYTEGDIDEFFRGILAATLIEKQPSLLFDLREHLEARQWRCRGVDLMKKTLDGDDPFNEFLTLLRSRGSWGQMVRSVFPWYVIAPTEIWEKARLFGEEISKNGWCKISNLGGAELNQGGY